jgi:hypothetical protein
LLNQGDARDRIAEIMRAGAERGETPNPAHDSPSEAGV